MHAARPKASATAAAAAASQTTKLAFSTHENADAAAAVAVAAKAKLDKVRARCARRRSFFDLLAACYFTNERRECRMVADSKRAARSRV